MIKYCFDIIFFFVLIYELEIKFFGVLVLIIFMMVVLMVGDVFVIVVSRELYFSVVSVFVKNYFGGVIGVVLRKLSLSEKSVRELVV